MAIIIINLCKVLNDASKLFIRRNIVDSNRGSMINDVSTTDKAVVKNFAYVFFAGNVLFLRRKKEQKTNIIVFTENLEEEVRYDAYYVYVLFLRAFFSSHT